MKDYPVKFNLQGSKFKVLVRCALAMWLAFSIMGCAALTTYPPHYQPSEWETSIGPPYWYLNETDGPFAPETIE
jgi:hypothetical protein